MPTITTADGTEIFYKDWGSGQPVVFSHGWPLSSDDWDAQLMFFLLHGYRVVAHDMAKGCAAAYYPEANVLMPLDGYDKQSGTPSYKSTPVRVVLWN